jgi:hypothetical protein
MIVYLGMPRCASSWLYNNLKHVETGELVKEPHTLYTNPINLNEYCNNRVLDFSTNNWSMDSDVAKAIDVYVSDYILIVRNPIDLAVSYKSLFNSQQSLDDFVSTMIINKLLCYGDIIERWYSLVDPNKIHIYDYNDLQADNTKFITDVISKLGINLPLAVNNTKINVSKHKEYTTISNENLLVLQQQVDKFNEITNQAFNISINNKL